LAQFAAAVGPLIGPALAGVLLMLIQIEGLILIDFASFLFAVTTLILAHIPRLAATSGSVARPHSLLREAAQGWVYLRTRPGLLALQMLTAINNFLFSIVIVLFTPLGLSLASPAVLGTIISVASSGMLVGTVILSVWGGPQRRIRAIFCYMCLGGLSIMLGGLRPSDLAREPSAIY
jgi:hypothetical protein